MTSTRLVLTRDQILAFRQRAGGLTGRRMPREAASLAPAERDAVLAEAESLPLPGAAGRITVRWAS